jgi:hypothetical protein
MSWSDRTSVGRAHLKGRTVAMREADTNEPTGRRYNQIFGEWLTRHGFADIDKGDRSRLFEVMDHLDEIEGWLATLPTTNRLRLNHPATVLRKWRQHEARLVELAKRLGGTTPCFLNGLRDELDAILPTAEKDTLEPWPDPVNTATLLNDVTAQLRRYIVIHDGDAMTAIVLWAAFAWLHNAIAVHSPLLVVTGAGENIAKTLLCGVLQRLTPNA